MQGAPSRSLEKSWKPGQENELGRPRHSRKSARKREREREGHRNPSLWWNKGALLNSVWIYIPYYKVASSDKDQKTRLYKLPRKQGVIEAIKPKDNPYQKKVVDNPFHHMEKLMKEILCKNPISLISVLSGTDKEQRAQKR